MNPQPPTGSEALREEIMQSLFDSFRKHEFAYVSNFSGSEDKFDFDMPEVCLDGDFDLKVIADALLPIIDRERRAAVEEALEKIGETTTIGKWRAKVAPEEKQRVLSEMFP